MKVMIKGGIWKNSEDEILKAAVMKYGLNNWSRIASLLVRKTPSQCKARWYEWLDPSIKKIEWNREEDEKLLHLAKIFPAQWRTIAPVVGRTAHQCQERYDKLLDEAQGRDTMDESDPRRLRPGEIDPAPETKPAKADPADMDDDEKAMLQEARARLANVQGKKAKRKEREKMMEETRRLSQLQKDREMRAAGLSVGLRKLKRNEIDYVKEIPFEAQPVGGVHQYGSEEEPKSNLRLKKLSAQKIEGLNRHQEEMKHKKEDERTIKKLKETKMPLDFAKEEKKSAKFAAPLIMPVVSDSEDDEEEYDEGPSIKSLLKTLPAVENEVEIEPEELEDEDEEELMVDRDAENVREDVWKSAVVARNLPRPKYAKTDLLNETDFVRCEAAKLALRDAIDWPAGRPFGPSTMAADRAEFTPEELAAAAELIAKEVLLNKSAEIQFVIPDAPFDERKTQKLLETRRSSRNAARAAARDLLGPAETQAAAICAELNTVYDKIMSVRREIRTIRNSGERATNESFLQDMRDKLSNEKSRNKYLQDQYMRMTSFFKQLS